jgi:hypothetical protein
VEEKLMAYRLNQDFVGYKNFMIYPGQEANLSVKVLPFTEETEFRCVARNRLSKTVQIFDVEQEGSNAGYVSIRVPKHSMAPVGFTYQVQQKEPTEDTWHIVASGTIFGRIEALTDAS